LIQKGDIVNKNIFPAESLIIKMLNLTLLINNEFFIIPASNKPAARSTTALGNYMRTLFLNNSQRFGNRGIAFNSDVMLILFCGQIS
jgi:hypothetical protein